MSQQGVGTSAAGGAAGQPPRAAAAAGQQQQQRPPANQQQQQQQQQMRPQGANGAPRPQQQQQQMQRAPGQGPPQQQQQQRPPQGSGAGPMPGMARAQSNPSSAQMQQPQQQQRPPSATTAGSGGSASLSSSVRRGSPSPTPSLTHTGPPSRSSSNSSLSSLRGGGDDHHSHSGRPAVEMVDDIPLVAEVYENQRYYPMVGWSSKLMDRPPFSSEDGSEAKNMADFKVPPGWAWGGEWQVEVLDDPAALLPGQCLTDSEGWSYATEFSRHYRGSSDATLKAVRRRRHMRRRIPPAKSAKSSLAAALSGGAGANSLTVGYLRNPLAVASNNNLSVRVAREQQNANTMSVRAGAARPKGAGPSLAELYAKQTVETPAHANTAAAATSSASAAVSAASSSAAASAASPSASSPTPSADASPSPASANGAASPLSPAQSITSSGGSSIGGDSSTQGGGNTTGSNGSGSAQAGPSHGGSMDSPSLRPKYTPFSSMGMVGGLDSLSAGFGGFSFSGANGGAGAGGSVAAEKAQKSMVRLWEFQRYYPVIGWSDKMLPTDRGGRNRGGWLNESDGFKPAEPKESFQPGQGWTWSMKEWMPSVDSTTDADGWSYATEPSLSYHPKKGLEHFVRKRLWLREKVARASVNGGTAGGAPTPRGGSGASAGRKTYTAFFERLELLKKDLKAEENDDELVSMLSATW